MSGRRVNSPVSSEVRTGRFALFVNEETDEIAGCTAKPLTAGKISLAYTGGGNWLALCVDTQFSRSSTFIIRVKRDGTVVTIDRLTNSERLFGKLDLGSNGVPPNHFEVDLLKHYTKIRALLAHEIAAAFCADNESAPVAEVEFRAA